MGKRGKLSPRTVQGLIWGGALAFCVVLVALAFWVGGRPLVRANTNSPEPPRPKLPNAFREGTSTGESDNDSFGIDELPSHFEPKIAQREEHTNPADGTLNESRTSSVVPDEEWPEPAQESQPIKEDKTRQPKLQRKAISEREFIEISAEMVIASNSFANTQGGEEALREACDEILKDHGVQREVFQKMTDRIAADPKKSAEIRERIFERVNERYGPSAVRVRPGAGPFIDPKRQPPHSR